ncbi:hypothetical protein HPP92_027203 [Vanilla planifolia]|uniref:Uncharacterized protein n=1 Tax=Vanilla planifolia TaxID=51239 RepID=A0A835U884_VANPL|nr:hypothetical protein HPP92_027203 [Vanilla planifolia]
MFPTISCLRHPEANIHGVRDVEERSSRNFGRRSCFVYTVVWVPSALDLDFHTEVCGSLGER